MSFFPASALDQMQVLQQSAYNRTCAVGTYTETETAPGKYEEEWVEAASDIPCSYHPRAGSEIVRAGQLDAEQPVLVKMDYADEGGTARPVHAGSIVKMDDGEELEVVGPPEDVQGMGRWLHLTCRRTDTGGG